VNETATALKPVPDDGPRPRIVRVLFRGDWTARDQGLLSSDPRVRTLRKVLVTYPDVRHIRPDRVSLEPGTDRRVLDTVARFLERQQWLVKSVAIE
jgi:hypothetical protein